MPAGACRSGVSLDSGRTPGGGEMVSRHLGADSCTRDCAGCAARREALGNPNTRLTAALFLNGPAADDPFAGLSRIHVVLNWFEDLQARVPTGR